MALIDFLFWAFSRSDSLISCSGMMLSYLVSDGEKRKC